MNEVRQKSLTSWITLYSRDFCPPQNSHGPLTMGLTSSPIAMPPHACALVTSPCEHVSYSWVGRMWLLSSAIHPREYMGQDSSYIHCLACDTCLEQYLVHRSSLTGEKRYQLGQY